MSALRDLPSVDELYRKLEHTSPLSAEVIKNEIRSVLANKRAELLRGEVAEDIPLDAQLNSRLQALASLSLRRVINATGVVLHTNLGRAPLPDFTPITGYSNLEYDLTTGKRGKRDHHISPLLDRLIGRPGIAVNNNAAAVFLVLHELAAGSEVIVSRGELIEIGDGFRIPDIMLRSGAILREVGTTNRTTIEDYREAINESTHLLMRVHRSNFHVSGFTSRPSLRALAALGKERGVPVYEDLGSGCLVNLQDRGIAEPSVRDSLNAGMDLVSFSCDKLLGGPQAGIIAGDIELVRRIRHNPMYRAFRIDKLITQALQTSLQYIIREDWQSVPIYRMILAPLAQIRARAERVASNLQIPHAVTQMNSVIGGGSTPDQSLPSWVIEISAPDVSQLERRLRQCTVPVIARIEREKLILDMRTVADEEESDLIEALRLAHVCVFAL
jgi:L-seryl-tRNA(Ser) seleniumtransferase